MADPCISPITRLLSSARDGDKAAHEQLWSLIYDELRRLAQQQMAAEAPGHTLQPTALVHEAYFRLFGDTKVEWSNRRHFFGAAAKSMRQIRIDDARKRKRLKRGGSDGSAHLDGDPAIFDQDPTEVLAIHEALDKLEADDPRRAEIVMLRYFAGLTVEETATAIDLSRRTVQVEWRLARAWLHRELSKGDTRIEPNTL